MDVTYILLDDHNPLHQELAIYRTGSINYVKLTDSNYHLYKTLDVDAHNYAALFHYGLVDAMNHLPFITENGCGLDSGNEALLHHSTLPALRALLEKEISVIRTKTDETIVVGWQNEPVGIAYLRALDTHRFSQFLTSLLHFIEESEQQQYDLEFLW